MPHQPDILQHVSGSGHIFSGTGAVTVHGYTAKQVSDLLDKVGKEFKPKPFDGHSPYVGLASFQEHDADRFFGREKLTDQLVARVKNSRFIVIAGPSGSGKSSLARAGLIHALKNGAVKGSETWLYEILAPGRHPLAELARVVASLTKTLQAGDEIQQRGREDATLLHRWAEIALGDQRTRRAILFVDQFEESFTQADKVERTAFFNLLIDAATIENGRVTVVCATRSDFIGNWVAYPNLNAQLSHAFDQIPPMQPDELISAVARPALQVGLQIDPELVKQILDDMRDAPGALPLMQFALDDLFDDAITKGGGIALTRKDYLERGGLEKNLERHADAEFAKLSEEEQKIARNVFASLIDLVPGTVNQQDLKATKRTALFQELVPAGSEPALTHRVILKLAAARLVTTNEQEGHETVTLAHDRLIGAWGLLQRLVTDRGVVIALQNQIAEDAQKWELNRRDASYLYIGARLKTARETLIDKKVTLSALADAFLQDGIEADEERLAKEKESQCKRNRQLAETSWLASQQAGGASLRKSEASQIKATHYLLRATSAASAADDASGCKNALLAARWRGSRMVGTILHDSAVIGAAISPNGQQIISWSERGLCLLSDCASGVSLASDLRHNLRHGAPNKAPKFSSNGHRVLSWMTDDAVQLWNTADGSRVGQLLLHGDQGADFTPDGRHVVVWGRDGTIQLWNAVDGSPAMRPIAAADETEVVISNRDGSRLMSFWSGRSFVELFACSARKVKAYRLPNYDSMRPSFSPNGRYVLTFPDDLTLCLWSAVDGRMVGRPLKHQKLKEAIFVEGGRRVLTWSRDDAAQLWSVPGSRSVGKPMRHEDYQVSPLYDAKSRRILTWPTRETLRLHSASDASVVGKPMIHPPVQFNSPRALFSPAGDVIVSWDEDRALRLWKASDGESIGEPLLHKDVSEATFDSTGRRIASWSWQGDLRLWDVGKAGAGDLMMRHEAKVNGATFCASDRRVASWSDDFTVRLWDPDGSWPQLRQFRHRRKPTGATISPSGQRVFTWGMDRSAQLWNSADGNTVGDLIQNEKSFEGAQFSPDENSIVTWSKKGFAQLWDAENGKPIGKPMRHPQDLWGILFSRDGRRLLTGCHDGAVRIWNVTDGSLVGDPVHHEARVCSMKITNDGQQVVTWSEDGVVQLRWASDGLLVCPPLEHEGAVNGVEFSATDDLLLSWSNDRTARLWSHPKGTPVGQVMNHPCPVLAAGFSPKGDRIFTIGEDNSVWIWKAPEGVALCQPMEHDSQVWRTAIFAAEGRKLISFSLKRGGYVGPWSARVWDASDGRAIGPPFRGQRQLVHCAFDPQGKLLAVCDYTIIQQWNLAEAQPHGSIMEHKNLGGNPVYTNDASQLLSWGGNSIRLWNTNNSQLIGALRCEDVSDACFSIDENCIMATSEDGTARIWDISTEETVSVDESILEFEIRSATTLGPNGEVRLLTLAEWEAKRRQVTRLRPARAS